MILFRDPEDQVLASSDTSAGSTSVNISPMTAEPNTATPATIVVLRLRWSARSFSNLVSSALFRDYLLGRPPPPPRSVLRIRLFDQHVVQAEVLASPSAPSELSAVSPPSVCDLKTSVHLIPPLPPWLHLSSPAHTSHSRLCALLCHSLHQRNLIESKYRTSCLLPTPRVFLLQAPRASGKSSAVVRAANQSHALLIRATPSYILPRAATTSAFIELLQSLVRTAVEASAVSPCGTIILLDDADFLFPPQSHGTAQFAFSSAFPPISDIVRSVTTPVTLVLTASTPVHPNVQHCVDVVFVESGEKQPEAVEAISNSSETDQLTDQVKKLSLNSKSVIERRWGDIRDKLPGTEHALRLLRRVMRRREYEGAGVRPPRALLLYGAPGTGKTALVRAAAKASGQTVTCVDAAQLAHGEVGESEVRLRRAFANAEKHGDQCILFFDEVDTLFGTAGAHAARLVATFARCLDTSNVAVVAATNRPWMVAKALRRPGRLDYCVRIGLPSAKQRSRIAHFYGEKMGLDRSVRQCLERVAQSATTEGMSAADIVGACRNATMTALWREDPITECDVMEALDSAGRSVSRNEASRIDGWQND